MCNSLRYPIFAAMLLLIGGIPALQAQDSIHVDLVAQPLGDALRAIGIQTNTSVAFDPALVAGQQAHELRADLTLDQALNRLLEGTDIKPQFVNEKTVVLAVARPLPAADGTATTNAARSSGVEPPAAEAMVRDTPPASPEPLRVAQVEQSKAASAAAADAQSPGEDAGARLQEIVVTAQKRSEDLQNVPVSVQVIDSRMLQQQNQNSLTDLTRTLPSLHIATGAKSNSLAMRGIGSPEENPGFDQAVAMFSDDIYRGRSRMSAATFLDLDHIEILKGPQSTFFGNNAIAGALNLITKKPSDTYDGYVRALAGMFEQYALEGAVGGPIADTLQARVAVAATGNERGWLHNVNTGEDIPRIHDLAGRVTLLYKPTENLDATLKLEGSRHKTEGSSLDAPAQWIDCPYPPFPAGFLGLNDSCTRAAAIGVPQGFHNRDVALLGGEMNQLSNDEAVLTVNYRQWDHEFTSVTGYSYYDFTLDSNAADLPIPDTEAEWREHYHQFSQELRVTSPTNQPLEYLLGAYLQSDQLAYDQIDTIPALNPLLQGIPLVAPYLPGGYRQGIVQKADTYSGFGSATWNATDRLKVSASLRWSKVDKQYTDHIYFGTSQQLYGGFIYDPIDVQQFLASAFGASQGQSPLLKQSSHGLMPSARIQYQIAPQVMAYFRFDRGFLSGGFSGADVNNFGTIDTFGPEHVNAFEAGIKSKWLDDKLLLNADVFLANYTDLQVASVSVFYQPISQKYYSSVHLQNAAKSRSEGVELEAQWVPVKDLNLGANVTYLKAYYLSYPSAGITTVEQFCGIPVASAGGAGTPYCAAQFPNGVPLSQDLSGQSTAYAPRWSGNLSASYGLSIGGHYRLTTELDPFFTSSYYFLSGDPIYQTGGYVRLDGRVTFAPLQGHWGIDLIGKNLTDRDIVTVRGGLYSFSKEQPRNVAVQFRYTF